MLYICRSILANFGTLAGFRVLDYPVDPFLIRKHNVVILCGGDVIYHMTSTDVMSLLGRETENNVDIN